MVSVIPWLSLVVLLGGSADFSKAEGTPVSESRLRLYHTHARERLDVVYRAAVVITFQMRWCGWIGFCGIIAPATCITMIRGCWIC
jgi:hypothetical protein